MSKYIHPGRSCIVLGAMTFITAVAVMSVGAYHDQLSKPQDDLRDAVWNRLDRVMQLREQLSNDPLLDDQLYGIVMEMKALVSETGMLITYILQYQAREDTGEKEWISSMGVLKGLTFDLDDRKFIGVLLPLLEAHDERLYDVAQDFLGPFIQCECDGIQITFRAFDEYFRQEKLNVPRGLVRFMYDRAPGKSLLYLGRNQGRVLSWSREEYNSLFWVEHQVADVLWKWRYYYLPRNQLLRNQVTPEAAEALADLVDHPQWWVRLYVAEIMRQHPAFRTDELIAVLLADTDESVQSVVTSFVTNNAQDD